MLINVAICGCVRIEIANGVFYSREMFRRMRAQQFDFVGRDWIAPFPSRMSILRIALSKSSYNSSLISFSFLLASMLTRAIRWSR